MTRNTNIILNQVALLLGLDKTFVVACSNECTSIILDSSQMGELESVRHYQDRMVISIKGFDNQEIIKMY